MEVKTNIKKIRTLKDFTRLLIAFVCCLVALSLYQQFSLFYGGVIEKVWNKTIVLLALNHLGFSAILSFLLLLVFRFLEKSKPGMGFRLTLALFSSFLLFEALLIEYFIGNYSLIHLSDIQSDFSMMLSGGILLKFMLVLLVAGLLYFLFYKLSWFLNPFIGKMYPFTIILFLMVLGTSVTDKKPINQNKSMDFITEAAGFVFNFNVYEGVEYPLLRQWKHKDAFVDHFNITHTRPNVVIVVIDGLSNEFLMDGKYAGFTPFLDSIATKSLYWNHFLANSNSKTDAVPNILGSLPQGEGGFTTLEHSANRNTIFGILKTNGYHTGFYYGGNSALNNLNKFLNEEDVDVVLDKSRFNDTYKLQEADRAGVTLGYPDSELYKKWGASYFPSDRPKLEFFLNLSTTKPFSIPDAERYVKMAKDIMEKKVFGNRDERFIDKNIELFAAMHYADSSLERLFKMYALTKDFDNTVFLITGSGKSYLPKDNTLKEYQVPLVINSPLLKERARLQSIASHHDIIPSILRLVQANYELKLPSKTAFMGNGLIPKKPKVVLSVPNKGVKGMIRENYFVIGREVMEIGDGLELLPTTSNNKQSLKDELKRDMAINIYVTSEDKIIPKEDTIYETGKKKFSKEELVWISSVFNGKNFDNAYTIARKLAHEGNYDKSLVLTSYILENAPNNIDALILQGRIYAWKKHYNKSISILERAVDLHPFYHDGYSALLDVYFWSGNNIRASQLYEKIKENNIETVALVKKVERCMDQIRGIEDGRNNRTVEIQFDESNF
ncbi:MAG: sulfatase-like hydrolase/transferase [Bacteroidota bacterium]